MNADAIVDMLERGVADAEQVAADLTGVPTDYADGYAAGLRHAIAIVRAAEKVTT